MPEEKAFTNWDCSPTFEYTFAKSDHVFGVIENVTQTIFYIYLHDFHPSLLINISFSQNMSYAFFSRTTSDHGFLSRKKRDENKNSGDDDNLMLFLSV